MKMLGLNQMWDGDLITRFPVSVKVFIATTRSGGFGFRVGNKVNFSSNIDCSHLGPTEQFIQGPVGAKWVLIQETEASGRH